MDTFEECIKKMKKADALVSETGELLYNEASEYSEGKLDALLYVNAQVEYLSGMVNSMVDDIEDLRDDLLWK